MEVNELRRRFESELQAADRDLPPFERTLLGENDASGGPRAYRPSRRP